MKLTIRKEYEDRNLATRAERMRWWKEARFGMFVHFGLYSLLGRHEWAMATECIPKEEYGLGTNFGSPFASIAPVIHTLHFPSGHGINTLSADEPEIWAMSLSSESRWRRRISSRLSGRSFR